MAKTYTYESIYEIVKSQGYTDYQAETIYDEQNLSNYEGDEENDDTYNDIVAECDDWWDLQMTMERCNGMG